MRLVIFIVAFVLFSATTFAQSYLGYGKTRADYERVVGKFKTFYNQQMEDSVFSILSDKWTQEEKKRNWNGMVMGMIRETMGDVVSYKYIDTFNHQADINGNPMVYFKLVFSKPANSHVPSINGKKEHAMCMSLDENGKIFGFNFITTSPAVDSLISKY